MKNKKILWTMSFFLLLACGEDFEQGDNLDRDLNRTKVLVIDEEINSEDRDLIKSFCSKLDQKVMFFNSSYVGETRTITSEVPQGSNQVPVEEIVPATLAMKVTTSNCSEEASEEDKKPTIKNLNENLFFSDGVPFPQVITRNASELGDLCNKVQSGAAVLNYTTNGNEATWYEVMEFTDRECALNVTDENTICLKITTGERGSVEEDYKIFKIDFMKTTLANNSFQGVISSRNVVDSRSCEQGKFSLKGQEVTDLP